MSTKEIVSAWLTGLVLVGCAKAMSDEAARVRITNTPEIARGCAFVGMASDDSITDLQGKAARLGGDVAVVTMQTQGARGVTYTTVEVFRCGSPR
jgi:hypothetical protein